MSTKSKKTHELAFTSDAFQFFLSVPELAGTKLTALDNRLSREEAAYLYEHAFSGQDRIWYKWPVEEILAYVQDGTIPAHAQQTLKEQTA